MLRPLPIFLFIAAITLLDVFVLPSTAVAGNPGLYWENSTKGLAKVQRLVDTSNGIVCYIAINVNDRTQRAVDAPPSISCVKP